MNVIIYRFCLVGLAVAVLGISSCATSAGNPRTTSRTPDVSHWITDPATGCTFWNPNPDPNEAISWAGACNSTGRAEGFGTLQWYMDGKPTARFTGNVRNGKQQGKGKYVWPNGDIIDCDWVDGKCQGKGKRTWGSYNASCKDKLCYKAFVGEYSNDRMSYGKMTFFNGHTYEGAFDDQEHIKGTIGKKEKKGKRGKKGKRS